MKSGRRSKLSNKAIAFCTLFALFLSLLIGGVGYYRYSVSIEESYENYARTLISIISEKIDTGHLEASIKTGIKDAAYDALQQELNHVKENSDAQYIYMICYPEGVEQGTLAYVMTGYTPEELLYESDTISYLGDIAETEDFGEEFRRQMQESVAQNDTEIRYIDNSTQVAQGSGNFVEYMKTAYKPIRNESGELISILCTDISMTRIYNNLHSYLVSVAVGAVIVVVVFLALFLFVMNRQVLGPIKMIAEQADDFVKQSYAVSDPSQFQFQEIQTRTRDEIQSLAESLNHTMKELIHYMVDMKTMSVTQERISAELDVAKQIQLNLYPCTFPAYPERSEFDIYAKLEFAKGAGGDFYNFFFTDSTHLCMMMGSVSGSGIPAIMLAAITTTIMKSYAQLGYLPARIMAETNNQISNNNRAELNVSAFLGILNLVSGKLDYVNSGDMIPLIKKSGQVFEPLPNKKGIRLGSMENVPYFQQSVRLVQGDMLFLYSPGVAEASDERGNVYSDSCVTEQMNEITKQEIGLERIIGVMSEDIRKFQGRQPQEQDHTMLMIRYYG
ncbi:MAG: SpoIIE family protein phosphatase [Lacrimispora sp.]|uniref:SpoIIE family protein phosphatase n=1 Tax=Lacrimispora sp. TaxID=2719234 RepID=UPI0039E25F8D